MRNSGSLLSFRIVTSCLIVPSLKVRGEGVFTRELEEDMRYMMEPPGIQTSPLSE